MVDIHSHIIPELDDGARNMQEALGILRKSVASGVKSIVATPHFNPNYGWDNYNNERLQGAFEELKMQAGLQAIPIELLLGMEIRITDNTAKLLEEGKLTTINQSRYVLLEFADWESTGWCLARLREVVELGYIPVIAHPERYCFVQESPWLVTGWLAIGCHLQITKASVFGRFDRAAKIAADYLLDNDYVACIASDAHGSEWRTSGMDEIYQYLSEVYGESYANMLTRINPDRICRNKKLY